MPKRPEVKKVVSNAGNLLTYSPSPTKIPIHARFEANTMLAAAPRDRHALPNLLDLAFRMISAKRDVPSPLSDHVLTIAKQALKVASDPTKVDKDTAPDAIRLALEISTSQELKKAVEEFVRSGSSPQIADSILNMEMKFAGSR